MMFKLANQLMFTSENEKKSAHDALIKAKYNTLVQSHTLVSFRFKDRETLEGIEVYLKDKLYIGDNSGKHK